MPPGLTIAVTCGVLFGALVWVLPPLKLAILLAGAALTITLLRRPLWGNRALKRVFFYQSAFCSLGDPLSRAFYDRKRAEGKRHHQALIALARRRINVLWAMLDKRTPFDPQHRKAA